MVFVSTTQVITNQNTNLSTSVDTVFINPTNPNLSITVNLPDISSTDGIRYWIKRLDSAAPSAVIVADGTQLIDGSTSMGISTGQVYDLVSINGNWTLLNNVSL